MPQCQFVSSDGVPCTKNTFSGFLYCWRHWPVWLKGIGVVGVLGALIWLIGFTADLKSHGFPIPDLMQNRDQNELRKYAYSQLEKTTTKLIDLVSEIIILSTDGWLPQNEDDFFSSRAANLVCSRLNIESQAPVVPDRNWLVWIEQNTRKAMAEFDAVLTSYGSVLSAELLQKVAEVKNSYFLAHPGQRALLQRVDQEKGYQRPPLLCSETESALSKSLISLRQLYDELWSITGSEKYPMPSRDHYLMNRVGKSRFTDDDLKKWVAEHPYAPSGKPPKRSDQN